MSNINQGQLWSTEESARYLKTYATMANAQKAVARAGLADVRHVMMLTANGRVAPVFVGEAAVQAGAHFQFAVVG